MAKNTAAKNVFRVLIALGVLVLLVAVRYMRQQERDAKYAGYYKAQEDKRIHDEVGQTVNQAMSHSEPKIDMNAIYKNTGPESHK